LGFEIPVAKGRRIEYATRRLKLPAKPTLIDAEALLFTKYINWSYEQEIRVWAALNTQEDGLYFAYFGDELQLVRVIAGARCSLSESGIFAAPGADGKRIRDQGSSRIQRVRDCKGQERVSHPSRGLVTTNPAPEARPPLCER
jgi:hypothetical protein